MADMVLRNLDDELKQRLRERAAKHGRSMSAELRAIVAEALARPEPTDPVEEFKRLAAKVRGRAPDGRKRRRRTCCARAGTSHEVGGRCQRRCQVVCARARCGRGATGTWRRAPCPDLLFAEVANILWKKQRRGELAAEVPEIAARMLLNVGVQASACAELMPEATALAARLEHPPTIASIWRWRCVTAWSW